MQQILIKAYYSAYNFIQSGLIRITENQTIPSQYLVSAAPVPTALAIIALATLDKEKYINMKQGMKYLESTQLPSGGWGNIPPGPKNELATAICKNGLTVLEYPAVFPGIISDTAHLVAKTWIQDFAKLTSGWLPNQNPILVRLVQAVSSCPIIPSPDSITLKELQFLSRFLPPYVRPMLLATTLIKDISRYGATEQNNLAALELTHLMSPDGSWCEDIIATSLAVMALFLADLKEPILQACNWLCTMQYDHGGWPSFNQLFNWAVGWGALVLGENDSGTFSYTTPYLLKARNNDSSLGTTSPYSLPDLDDTAVGLSGLALDPLVPRDKIQTMSDMLLSLQDRAGSWNTFPSYIGMPPACKCTFPVYIKSEDVTAHVLGALLKASIPKDDARITKGLNWLLKRQHREGYWETTWFLGQIYATAQILDLLMDLEPNSPALTKGLNFLKLRQHDAHWDTGSAGETGLALYTLLKSGMAPNSEAVEKGLKYLASIQLPNGSFKPFYSGFYASGLYYEDPLSEAAAALRAIGLYLKLTD